MWKAWRTRLRTVHTSSTMHTIDAVDAALTRRHSFGTWLGKLPPYWQKAGAPKVARSHSPPTKTVSNLHEPACPVTRLREGPGVCRRGSPPPSSSLQLEPRARTASRAREEARSKRPVRRARR